MADEYNGFINIWDASAYSFFDVTEGLDNTNFDLGPVVESNSCMELIPLTASGSSLTVQVKEDPPFSNLIHTPSSLPASQNWPGDYDFNLGFNKPQGKNAKAAWTYSRLMDKLYVQKDLACPINFSANCKLPSDVFIRVLPLYSLPEHSSEAVRRCTNHMMEDAEKGILDAEHLVRCETASAQYGTDTAQRHNVKIPFENPPAGQEYSTYLFKFTCFGSCPGGLNRRPLMLIFSLEKGGEVVGRRKLDVKICACPLRDRKAEEEPMKQDKGSKTNMKRKQEQALESLSDPINFAKSLPLPPSKKAKPNGEGYYTLKVRDADCFEFLKQMKKVYKLNRYLQALPAEEKNELMNNNFFSSSQE